MRVSLNDIHKKLTTYGGFVENATYSTQPYRWKIGPLLCSLGARCCWEAGGVSSLDSATGLGGWPMSQLVLTDFSGISLPIGIQFQTLGPHHVKLLPYSNHTVSWVEETTCGGCYSKVASEWYRRKVACFRHLPILEKRVLQEGQRLQAHPRRRCVGCDRVGDATLILKKNASNLSWSKSNSFIREPRAAG